MTIHVIIASLRADRATFASSVDVTSVHTISAHLSPSEGATLRAVLSVLKASPVDGAARPNANPTVGIDGIRSGTVTVQAAGPSAAAVQVDPQGNVRFINPTQISGAPVNPAEGTTLSVTYSGSATNYYVGTAPSPGYANVPRGRNATETMQNLITAIKTNTPGLAPVDRTEYPEKAQVDLAKKFYSPENVRKCGTCPTSAVNAIDRDCREVLEIVRRVKRSVDILNQLLASANRSVLDIINQFIGIIPDPPTWDLRELLGLWTCPLTPQALALENWPRNAASAHRSATRTAGTTLNPAYYPAMYSQLSLDISKDNALLQRMDPMQYLKQVSSQWKHMAERFWADFYRFIDTQNPNDVVGLDAIIPVDGVLPPSGYDGQVVAIPTTSRVLDSNTAGDTVGNAVGDMRQRVETRMSYVRYVWRNDRWTPLADSSVKTFLRSVIRIFDELWALIKNIGYFALRVAVTKGSVALVRATCRQVYDAPYYSFKAFDEETRSFHLKGYLPSGCSIQAQPYVDALVRLYLKIYQWQTASFVVVA